MGIVTLRLTALRVRLVSLKIPALEESLSFAAWIPASTLPPPTPCLPASDLTWAHDHFSLHIRAEFHKSYFRSLETVSRF